jgi:uncharacterized membrane protein YqiK
MTLHLLVTLGGFLLGTSALTLLLGIRYIPHNKVGIVEKLWSLRGALRDGRLVARAGEAGYQAEILRGGLHWAYFPWQYRVHTEPLVVIAENRIGYIYARDGLPLAAVQTLGRVVACNDFQDAGAFLAAGGQRGRQRGVLREGVYAINTALFVVIGESRVRSGPLKDEDSKRYVSWQEQLMKNGGFRPVVIGDGGGWVAFGRELSAKDGKETEVALDGSDTIGVVTVHDGLPIDSHEIIAPEVGGTDGGSGHEYFQDPEQFLRLGGRRGKQLQVLTDGTFFINRWFATVEIRPKTLIPIGYVGVVVSFYGAQGRDLTGDGFRYGEQVEEGTRGVWRHALPPGKYALNPYALTVELVPTVNFVLRWVTGQVEAHHYDENLRSIEIITADGYEPTLPLSLVLHIDYQKAPSVVQRFGDVQRLISQTLDPILSAYFRDVAQSTQMLDLLTKRQEIQEAATRELGRRFQDYDINCIAVLIGRPESVGTQYDAGEDPIEALFDQLRQRRLAEEQILTYGQQKRAAAELRELADAQAQAQQQTELTQTRVQVDIAANRGAAELEEARRLAERDVVRAQGSSKSEELLGAGQSARIAQTGRAEAEVAARKVAAFGDARLLALTLLGAELATSQQPLVPDRVTSLGGAETTENLGLFGRLLTVLLAERSGTENAPEPPRAAAQATGQNEGPCQQAALCRQALPL